MPVGLPGSTVRRQAVANLAATLVRRAGTAISRRIAAVARPGDDDTVVVAFPFVHGGTAEAFAPAVAAAFADLTASRAGLRTLQQDIRSAMAGVDAGETVRALRPRIPVIAVTGTNGKTTTTRLIAHLMKTAGYVPGWSSTDGIFLDGEEVETGDWSGPGGAARVLQDSRVTVAVTETARGGILLRGMGTAVNDVSVVTNISADHLGLLGVHTVEDLAEVKSVVVRVTRPSGWTVLNAEDPLVRAMRAVSRARPWFFSLDPNNEHLDEALIAGGRAITVLGDDIAVLQRGLDPRRIIRVADVPMTLAGTSKVNVANALAATAAALAAGAPLAAVRSGLRTFASSAEQNSGRLNVYAVGGVGVVLDLAHNEASLASLLDVADGLREPGGELAVVVGTAGDRTDEAIFTMGAMAATRADRLVIAERHKYQRGRPDGEMETLWRAGAAEGGHLDVPVTADERTALAVLLDAGLPAGSVIAVCALEQRGEMAADITARGGGEMSTAAIAARVRA